jgi:hypothetical protein
MAQGMERNALGDSGLASGPMTDDAELTLRHGFDRVLSGKKPALRPPDPPPVAQKLQQLGRKHRMSGFAALAILDPQQHALAVDVRHLQRDDLGDTQAGAIGDAERRLVSDARHSFEEA